MVKDTKLIIEEIADEGFFESLMNSVLACSNPRYSTINETGLNSRGKAIADPLDGITLIQDEKGIVIEGILVAHTTTISRDLKTKLLSKNRNRPGDLVKCVEQISRSRKIYLGLPFVVILCTSHRIGSPLYNEIIEYAKENEFRVDVWANARIAKFLDSIPSGQYLRKRFLKIDAELPSKELLREICNKNLDKFQKELLGDVRPIHTTQESSISEAVAGSSSLFLIIADSGMGKSVICLNLAKRFFHLGFFAIRVKGETVLESRSIQECVYKELKEINPNLFIQEGASPDVFSWDRWVIIIDDINGLSSPSQALEKCYGWIKPKTNNEGNTLDRPPRLICPIWPSLPSNLYIDVESSPNVISKRIKEFSRAESTQIMLSAYGKTTSEADLKRLSMIAEEIGGDPFLLGLAGETFSSRQSPSSPHFSDQIFSRYIDVTTKKIKSNKAIPIQDFFEALSLYSYFLLTKNTIAPSSRMVRDWFVEKHSLFERVLEVSQDGRILIERNEKLVFRHDRFRNYFLIKAIRKLLAESTNHSFVEDPFWARLIGKAICDEELAIEHVNAILLVNPLAVFYSLKFSTSSSSYHQSIAKLLDAWVARWKNQTITVSPNSVWEIERLLLDIQSPYLLRITNDWQGEGHGHIVDFARFRNGSMIDGLRYFTCRCNQEPAIIHSVREMVMADVKANFKEESIEFLHQRLSSAQPNIAVQKGLLLFAGYICAPSLINSVMTQWKSTAEKESLWLPTIWAIINCMEDIEHCELLIDLLQFNCKLDDESDTRFDLENFQQAISRLNVPEFLIEFLIERVQVVKISKSLTTILSTLDSPSLIRYRIEEYLDFLSDAREKGHFVFPPISIMYSEYDTNRTRSRQLSSVTKNLLRSIWKGKDFSVEMRGIAGDFWIRNSTLKDLEILQSVEKEDCCYRPSIRRRLYWGDISIAPQEIVDFLADGPLETYHVYRIWSADLRALLENVLQKRVVFVGDLLLDIPEHDAEALLHDYPDSIVTGSNRFLTALYIGTRRCQELARRIFETSENKEKLFDHFSIVYTSMRSGRNKNFNLEKLIAVQPYLSCLTCQGLSSLINLAIGINAKEWIECYIKPIILSDSYRQKEAEGNYHLREIYYPSDDELIDEYLRRSKHCIFEDWIKRLEIFGWEHTKFLFRISDFVKKNKSQESYSNFGKLICAMGRRTYLSYFVDLPEIESAPSIKAEILKDIAFFLSVQSLD